MRPIEPASLGAIIAPRRLHIPLLPLSLEHAWRLRRRLIFRGMRDGALAQRCVLVCANRLCDFRPCDLRCFAAARPALRRCLLCLPRLLRLLRL